MRTLRLCLRDIWYYMKSQKKEVECSVVNFNFKVRIKFKSDKTGKMIWEKDLYEHLLDTEGWIWEKFDG